MCTFLAKLNRDRQGEGDGPVTRKRGVESRAKTLGKVVEEKMNEGNQPHIFPFFLSFLFGFFSPVLRLISQGMPGGPMDLIGSNIQTWFSDVPVYDERCE